MHTYLMEYLLLPGMLSSRIAAPAPRNGCRAAKQYGVPERSPLIRSPQIQSPYPMMLNELH